MTKAHPPAGITRVVESRSADKASSVPFRLARKITAGAKPLTVILTVWPEVPKKSHAPVVSGRKLHAMSSSSSIARNVAQINQDFPGYYIKIGISGTSCKHFSPGHARPASPTGFLGAAR
jgi:hypothetical protein